MQYSVQGYTINTGTSTITPSQAEMLLGVLYPNSNADLTSPARKVSAATMREAGWEISDDYATVFTQSYGMGRYEVLLTPIRDNGSVLTTDQFSAYVTYLGNSSQALNDDMRINRLVIGFYDTIDESNAFASVLHELHSVYYDGEEGQISWVIRNAYGEVIGTLPSAGGGDKDDSSSPGDVSTNSGAPASALRLEINLGTPDAPDWQPVNLNLDASISVTINSPLWSDQQSFSEEFNIPISANHHILGNVDEIYGGRIFQRLYKHQARLWVCGIPIFSGLVDMDQDVEFEDDSVTINIVAETKSLRERLDEDNVNARDVDFYFGCLEPGRRYDGSAIPAGSDEDDNATALAKQFKGRDIRNVPIGVCNDKTTKMHLSFGFRYSYVGEGTKSHASYILHTREPSTEQYMLPVDMPQMMFPKHYEHDSYINATHVYMPGRDRYKYPYCNVQAAVQRYECLKGSETESSGDAEWQSRRGYTLFGPERLNSSPCFFVLFWLEQLFDIYLGIDYDISPLTNDSDMLRLCFVNATCKFQGEREARGERTAYGYSSLKLKSDTLKLSALRNDVVPYDTTPLPGNRIQNVGSDFGGGVVFDGTTGRFGDRQIDFHSNLGDLGTYHDSSYSRDANFRVYLGSKTLQASTPAFPPTLADPEARFAMATSENIPDVSAKDVLEALENAFGFKFFYDELLNKVTVVRYNDLFRSKNIRTHSVVIENVHKRETNVRGFRLKYSSSQPAKKNVFTHREERVQGGDDTTFNYNDYRYVRHIQDGTQANDYVNIIKALGSYDETLFVSDLTGNAYRIKVDQDASDESKWYPSLFEVGGFRDVEYGDCSDDKFVKEISIGFKPFIPNDTSFEQQKELTSDTEATGEKAPHYAMFLDGEHHQPKNQGQVSLSKYMTKEWCWRVMNAVAAKSSLTLTPSADGKYRPQVDPDHDEGNMQANFNFYLPQGCDEGDINANPMNAIDMGFMLGFMRSSGETSYERYTTTRANYDGEGNHILEANVVIGNGTLSSDSIDAYGKVIGDISLKLKAEKPVQGDTKPYDALGNVDYLGGNTRYYPIEDKYARRGLFDRYWRDYAYFITHCRVALIDIPRDGMGISDLTSIDLTVPHRFGDYTGFIQSYTYSVDANGIASVSIELAYY